MSFEPSESVIRKTRFVETCADVSSKFVIERESAKLDHASKTF